MGREPLPDDIIPKLAVDDSKADVDMLKARALFELLVPDPESRHNLLLGTVYPYFRDSSEVLHLAWHRWQWQEYIYGTLQRAIGQKTFTIIDLIGMASSGFDRFSSAAMIAGKLVLQTPEAGMDNPKLLEPIKKIASGERFAARAIGGNMFTFKSDSVLFVDTNTDVELGESPQSCVGELALSSARSPYPAMTWKTIITGLVRLVGALSILMLAYEYLVYECEGKFFLEQCRYQFWQHSRGQHNGNTCNVMGRLSKLWSRGGGLFDVYLGIQRSENNQFTEA